jgi:RNA polymerase sigma factor (TIGR02999 family)
VLQQVLIDHARSRAAQKRGGGRVRLDLDPDLCPGDDAAVDGEAIGRALAALRELHERQAEVVAMRLFSGLAMEQIATVLGVSKRTVEDDWTVARAWLRRELARD